MNRFLIYGALLLGSYGVSAQSTPPATIGASATSTRDQLLAEIDQALNLQGTDIMNGIQGYGTDFGAIIKQAIEDQLASAIASALLTAPLAAKAMEKYEQAKNTKLAKKIAEVKETVKNMQGRINKLHYQNFKLHYVKQKAMAQTPGDIDGSVTEQKGMDVAKHLYYDYAKVMGEYDTDHTNALMTEVDPMLGYQVFIAAQSLQQGASKTESLYLKNVLAKRSFDLAGSTQNQEVVSITPYERMMIRRSILRRAQAKSVALGMLQKTVRGYVSAKQKRDYDKVHKQALGLYGTGQ